MKRKDHQAKVYQKQKNKKKQQQHSGNMKNDLLKEEEMKIIILVQEMSFANIVNDQDIKRINHHKLNNELITKEKKMEKY